ncbi:hypothetical protein HJC23_010586 [Cyclotella cryptica]|uniref:Uncharacterized protein n=1 Tax=Cyclotella cryptica TaxID=29204 RepID=A0ABD3PRB3_9STRA
MVLIVCSWSTYSRGSADELSEEIYHSPHELPAWLPRTSTQFLKWFTCSNANDFLHHIQYNDKFIQWVLSARHTTWTSGWEVVITKSLKSIKRRESKYDTNGKYYSRVFDLLNWSRMQNSLPQLIDVDEICHKGMEKLTVEDIDIGVIKNNVIPPEKPNLNIPDETWTMLWKTCHKQLNAQARIESSCIDIPATVVSNPDPPRKVNNPCHLAFRMVDGAHRLCLRKFLMSLVEGELLDYQIQLATEDVLANSSKNEIQSEIATLQMTMKRTYQLSVFVLNQTIFLDPHVSWARNEDTLTKVISADVKVDWVRWMERVMTHVQSQRI